MDWATKEWMVSHREKLGASILDIGSLDVNGSLRDVIPVTVGIDMRKGKGVDVICSVSDLKDHFKDGHFDSCVSAGTLEHVEDWKGFVNNTWDVVKEGGYLVMTMAGLWKGRHNYPNDYWRFTEDQIKEIYPTAEWVGKVGATSIGWVVKKEGPRPNVSVIPKAVG
jgi:SAM-dependent methyltransferase